MKETTMAKMGAILIFVGMFCATPVLAAMDPVLPGKFTGKIGTTDGFMSDKLSALSDLKSSTGFGKTEFMTGIYPSSLPGKDLSSMKNAPIDWDPSFMYYAYRNANRIPYCHF